VEYEVFAAKVTGAWNWVKDAWSRVKSVIGFLALIACIPAIPYLIWEVATHAEQRQAFGRNVIGNLKWYLLWAAVSWVVGKLYRRKSTEPEEIASGTLSQEGVQGSEPKDRRKNHRRVQRRR
jgi:hypothetical protein